MLQKKEAQRDTNFIKSFNNMDGTENNSNCTPQQQYTSEMYTTALVFTGQESVTDFLIKLLVKRQKDSLQIAFLSFYCIK